MRRAPAPVSVARSRARAPAGGRAIAACSLALALGAGAARAGPSPAPEAAPRVRTGAPIAYASRPRHGGGPPACSFRLPICVHSTRDVPAAASLAVLAAAERAWDALTGPLRFPAPDLDPDTLAYDVFLTGDARGPAIVASTPLEARDVRSAFDRARSFTVISGAIREGCTLDAAVAREIARAILWRVAPATDEGTARAQTTYLAHLVAPCAIAYAAAEAHAFQSRPERAVCDRHVGDEGAATGGWPEPPSIPAVLFDEGAWLYWSRIDRAYGASPASVVLATWALAPTSTPLGAPRWRDEPDVFDVLRVSFAGALSTGSKLDDLLLDTAVARAFMGSASDGVHQPETASLGDAARVALDWDLPWPSSPRRVAPRAPVAPTGSSYLVVRRAGAPPGARLRVEIAWEEHAAFRWALVKLDADGREIGRVPIPARERATEAQMTLADLDGTDRVLIVGVNAGDPAYAFDPDDEVWEPHAWLVTIASE